jgi:SHS2 domain-containing protein
MMETHDEVGNGFWIEIWCLIQSSKNDIEKKEQRELETKVGMTKEDFVAMWAIVIFKTNNFWGIFKRLKLKDKEKEIENLAI